MGIGEKAVIVFWDKQGVDCQFYTFAYLRAIAALDSCAHVDELERTRQGPFDVQDCLKVEEISMAGIHEKIVSHRSLVENYLDNQMAEYRLLQDKR